MSYAKTSPPILPDLFKRTRLFDLIDQYRDRQAIWVQGQAGAGKTSLVASYIKQRDLNLIWYQVDAGDDDPATFFHYFSRAAEKLLPERDKQLPVLTPESLPSLMLFARLYFRELFDKLPKPLLLVFDNFQEIAPDSALNKIVEAALNEIPQDISAILISRNPPPPSFSRMQFNRTLALLDQNALRLTDKESLGIAQLWLSGEVHAEAVQRMNELVNGWIAGLVLMLEYGGQEESATEVGRDHFFNYFASEIFDMLDADGQRFLLQTACLTNLTPVVVCELTGMVGAEAILEDLCERHYFTSRSSQTEPVYQYHPLFREFLLSRGVSDLGSEACQHITAKAAHILMHDGQSEEAVRLAQIATDWPFLCKIISQQAPILLGQQRFQLLEQWLRQLPQEQLHASPWLLYWFGCCRLPFDQQESGRHFDLAYRGFKVQQEQNGMLLSASGAILSIMTEWDDFRPLDPWIMVLDEMTRETPPYPSGSAEAMVVLAMLGALLFHKPQHPDMARWEIHADRLLREDDIAIQLRIDIGNVLVHWQYWKGDLAAATRVTDILTQLIEHAGSVTLPRLQSVMNHAIQGWHTAEFDHCLDLVADGLAMAAETGIHIMDDRLMAQSIYASLSQDDLQTANRFLDQMKPVLQGGRRLAISHYYYLSSNYHLIAGDLEMALQHGQVAVEINQEVTAPFPEGLACLTLAQILFEMGELEQATDLLTKVRKCAQDIRSRTLELMCELISAWFELQRRNDQAVISHLRRGLMLQRKMGFLNVPGWRNSIMKPLLLKALDNNIEVAFVQKLIYKRGLLTDAPPQASEVWPWPVKIYTLGRFSLIIDGQPLQFNGKAQQKPLELLKALIALGGREVSKDQLIDALWPDAEGDKAQRALDTTLHRFRKLIGHEQVIQLQDRKLSLNTQLCWVDIWAMERLLGQIEEFPHQAPDGCEQALKLQQHLFSLHKGSFLRGDSMPLCIGSYRDRLHNRLLNRLGLLGRHWENQTDWNRALQLYQKMLEMDDRQEAIYQRQMVCYRSLGLIAEAMAVYERCRKTLFTHHGISPSAETEALYQRLR